VLLALSIQAFANSKITDNANNASMTPILKWEIKTPKLKNNDDRVAPMGCQIEFIDTLSVGYKDFQ